MHDSCQMWLDGWGKGPVYWKKSVLMCEMPCRRRQGSDDEKGHEKRGRNNKLMNFKKKHQKIHMAADEKILRKAQKERMVC